VCSVAAVCAWQWWRRRCGRGSGGGSRARRRWCCGGVGSAAGVVRAAVLGWRRRPIGGGGGAGRWPAWLLSFFYLEKLPLPRAKWFTAHVCREHLRWLSAKSLVPAQRCREFPFGTGCAESIRACAERSLLSAQPQIPVVHGHQPVEDKSVLMEQTRGHRAGQTNHHIYPLPLFSQPLHLHTNLL
jgi:hypothetical protein